MKKVFLCVSCLIFLVSCASVIDGHKQQLSFDSNEKDVSIYVNGQFACRTPCVSDIQRGQNKVMVTAEKDGFERKTLFLNRNLNSSAAFNILSLWTSTFGVTTDLTLGNIWEYQPNSVYVVMAKEPKTEAERKKLEHQNAIRDFVLRNFDQLQSDASNDESSGEYIKAIAQMANTSPQEIKSVFRSSYVAADCAERIVGIYVSK